MKISENEKYIFRVLMDNYEKITSMSCTQLVKENYISRSSFYVLLNKMGFSSYYTFQNSIRFKVEENNKCLLLEKLAIIRDIYTDYDLTENLLSWINDKYVRLYNVYCDLEEYNDTEMGEYLEKELLRVLYNMTLIFEGELMKSPQAYKVVEWLL